MLNSIMMLGSTWGRSRKVNIVCALVWLSFMLGGSNFRTGLMFIVLNILSFGVAFGLSKLFKGKVMNTIVATSSILIWSIAMDILCFVFAPSFVMGQTLGVYVMNGILFNFKYFVMNVVVVGLAHSVKAIMNRRTITDKVRSF